MRIPLPLVLRSIAGCALSLAALTADASCSGDPWLTLEIVAGELQGDGLAEFVEIDRDGCVLSQYGDFDRRAGQYERRLSAADQASLVDALNHSALVNYDAEAHREQRAATERAAVAAGAGELHYVADADWVRLRIREASGDVRLIEWPSPQLYSELDPADLKLAKLAEFVRKLRIEGADPRRARLSGDSP